MNDTYILLFQQCEKSQHARVGGKCASLGAMIQAGAPVPPGFAVTTDAYSVMMATNDLGAHIQQHIGELDFARLADEEAISRHLRGIIEQTPIPFEIENAIRDAYAEMCETYAMEIPVAVRSSATAEDLPGASFAGQQDTFLWIVGADNVVTHVRKCWSSLYTARAISYRHDNGFPHDKVLMSVGVQKMVNARAAGVAMTLNPINGDRSKIVIDASWGLGETVVGGIVTPDNFVVDKVIFEIVGRTISDKHIEIVADVAGRKVIEREIESERRALPALTDAEVIAVAKIAKRAEKFYSAPQDVEWALDAELSTPDNVVVLQSRPETVWSQKQAASKTAVSSGLDSVVDALLAPLKEKR